ncbi:DUF2809 domain-containing protein [Subtercola vilae]|uniref:DUF2809 domain-containing protein n=1 Tax=Subtercola vilae TaxID=2056433 RepID=UPI00191DF5D8|nr:DUF2809 domain-containing protein [Subtercola vilae]
MRRTALAIAAAATVAAGLIMHYNAAEWLASGSLGSGSLGSGWFGSGWFGSGWFGSGWIGGRSSTWAWILDASGDALYAALIYLLLALILTVRQSPRLLAAGLALAFCWIIEFLQLTDLPARIDAAFPPAALVLGSTFAPTDLAAYAVGVTLALLADVAVSTLAGHPLLHARRPH